MKYEFDLKGGYNPDDVYAVRAEQMELPDYFGYNLDALHDWFTEIGHETEISFTGVAEAEVMMSKYMRNLKRLCAAVEKENEHMKFRFDD